MSPTTLSLRLCVLSALCFCIGAFCWFLFDETDFALVALFFGFFAALIGSIPALVVLLISIGIIQHWFGTVINKFLALIFMEFFIALGYGVVAGLLNTSFNYEDAPWTSFLQTTGFSTAALFASALCALLLSHKKNHNILFRKHSFINSNKHIHGHKLHKRAVWLCKPEIVSE